MSSFQDFLFEIEECVCVCVCVCVCLWLWVCVHPYTHAHAQVWCMAFMCFHARVQPAFVFSMVYLLMDMPKLEEDISFIIDYPVSDHPSSKAYKINL